MATNVISFIMTDDVNIQKLAEVARKHFMV